MVPGVLCIPYLFDLRRPSKYATPWSLDPTYAKKCKSSLEVPPYKQCILSSLVTSTDLNLYYATQDFNIINDLWLRKSVALNRTYTV